jgi:polysaccharide export outer membrane protein
MLPSSVFVLPVRSLRSGRSPRPLLARPAERARAELRVVVTRITLGPVLLALVLTTAAQAVPAQSTAASQTRTAGGGEIRAGDKLMLRVWREPSLSDSLVVDERGDVVLPRVGVYRVAGMTAEALRDTLTARLATILREPAVEVRVLRRVTVTGEVRKPNVYFVDGSTSVRELLAAAGGIAEAGDANRVEIVRERGAQRVGRLARGVHDDVPIRSGDEISVGRRSWLARNALAALSSVAVAASVLISALRR